MTHRFNEPDPEAVSKRTTAILAANPALSGETARALAVEAVSADEYDAILRASYEREEALAAEGKNIWGHPKGLAGDEGTDSAAILEQLAELETWGESGKLDSKVASDLMGGYAGPTQRQGNSEVPSLPWRRK